MMFELPLQEAKVKPHQVTALHLMVALVWAGAGAVMALALPSIQVWGIGLLVAGVVLLLVVLVRNKWLKRPPVNRFFRIAELMVLLCMASYFAIAGLDIPAAMCGVLGAAILFAIFWEQQTQATLTVRVDEKGVKLPAAMRRQLHWEEIEQVLLRFGVLTINCLDNRLFQWPVGKIDVDTAAFEQFCLQCIAEGKEKRDPNAW